MKKVALLLSSGFEEGEAINVIDILRRLNISVTVLSCDKNYYLMSYHGVNLYVDDLLDNQRNFKFDAIALVGGPPNTDKLGSDKTVIQFIQEHIDSGAYIGALCSSGAKVLARNSLLSEHHYVCCGNLHRNYDDGLYVDQPVVIDGQFVTGQDYGVTIDFAFALASVLIGKRRTRSPEMDDIDWVAKHINYNRFTNYHMNSITDKSLDPHANSL
ncbi:DJ-1/PfpI family protein [Photobacterium sp. DNB23_23_1]